MPQPNEPAGDATEPVAERWTEYERASSRRVQPSRREQSWRLSAFYGIVITMYWRDHPPPHFHADYSGYAAKIEIETLQVIEGFVPPRALRLIGEWAELHRDELRDNWARAVSHDALVPIDPLQ